MQGLCLPWGKNQGASQVQDVQTIAAAGLGVLTFVQYQCNEPKRAQMHLKYLCLLAQLRTPSLSAEICLLWLPVTALRKKQAPLEGLKSALRNTPLAAKAVLRNILVIRGAEH